MTNAIVLRRAGLAAAAAALAAVLAGLASRVTPPAAPPPSLAPAAPVSAAAPDPAEWHEKARPPDVSAGVLVRVASRRPLDRDLACAPATAPGEAGTGSTREAAAPSAAAVARCTPGVDEIEDVEIDWNGTKPAP